MGSRAVVIVCRDEDSARKKFRGKLGKVHRHLLTLTHWPAFF